jgi:hypothetical protein
VPDWLTDRLGGSLPTVYLPLSKADTVLQVVVRAEGGPAAIPALKRAVRAWDCDPGTIAIANLEAECVAAVVPGKCLRDDRTTEIAVRSKVSLKGGSSRPLHLGRN